MKIPYTMHILRMPLNSESGFILSDIQLRVLLHVEKEDYVEWMWSPSGGSTMITRDGVEIRNSTVHSLIKKGYLDRKVIRQGRRYETWYELKISKRGSTLLGYIRALVNR